MAAAFASLSNIDTEELKQKPNPKSLKYTKAQLLDNQIMKATDLNNLLLVAENPVVSRRHALKVI